MKKSYKEYKGFERLNRPYWDKINELFLRETGISFYELLKEEFEKWEKAQQKGA